MVSCVDCKEVAEVIRRGEQVIHRCNGRYKSELVVMQVWMQVSDDALAADWRHAMTPPKSRGDYQFTISYRPWDPNTLSIALNFTTRVTRYREYCWLLERAL
jgi:hypothetical protein